MAGATTRLRVGSLVLSNDYRHPVMLAKEIATLDVLSGGRVELGLGAGFSKVVLADQRPQAAERLACERGWEGISAEQVLERPSVFIGSTDRIVDEMRGRRDRYGFSYYVVLDHTMEEVGPIVARLAGT